MSYAPRETVLLARYAEGLFWMARYVERVENLARLIDVTQTFESPGREDEAWSALLRINADDRRFLDGGGTLEPDRIKAFYLLDRTNPTSIQSTIEAARTNARTLRPLISTEMWMQMNVFHREIGAITADQCKGDLLTRLCSRLKEGVQAHTGITEGTFFRDQGWNFYQLGRLIERADQTTRLLDIKYHLLQPWGHEEKRLANQTQWSGVLRAAAGYHAFRRVAPAGFEPVDVVAFLLSDRSIPPERDVVRQPDGVAPDAVAEPLRPARHGARAGADRGNARGIVVEPGGEADLRRVARFPRCGAAGPDLAGCRNRQRFFPGLEAGTAPPVAIPVRRGDRGSSPALRPSIIRSNGVIRR